MKHWLVALISVAMAPPGACLGAEKTAAHGSVNTHYVVNREPLRQTAYVHLPAGAGAGIPK